MSDLNHFALFFAASLLLALTPGPGIFYVAARTLAAGRGEGIASSLGTGLDGMVHVIGGSVGVSAILLASAELFAAMKLIGAAYLIWLGMRTIRAARRDGKTLGGGTTETPLGVMRAFREGIMVEALNPKTAAFFLAFVPQFVDVKAGHVGLQFIALGFLSVTLNSLADVAVAFAAGSIRSEAAQRPRLISRLRQGSGAAMIALGAGLAFAKRP